MPILEAVLTLILFVLGSIRVIRWFGILQQKEYRLDRLWLFLNSPEGVSEILKLSVHLDDFKKSHLKRPKLTKRMLVCLVVFCLLHVVLLPIFFSIIGNFFSILLWYVSIPGLVLLSSVPTTFVSQILTQRMLRKAQQTMLSTAPTIIGITGSYGKTATKQLLAHVLGQQFSVFVTPKSFNTRYSVAKSVVDLYDKQEITILEYGAYTTGEIATLARVLQPAVAVITGLSPQHLGLFGNLENIINAKSELIAALPKDGKVFYNQSNPKVIKIVKLGEQKWQSKFSQSNQLKIIGCEYQQSAVGFRYSLDENGRLVITYQKAVRKTNLVGLQYAETCETVAVIALNFGMSTENILAAIASFVPSEQFMRIRRSKRGGLIIDDGGSSNPAGFSVALNLLGHVKARKKMLITSGIVDLGTESEVIHLRLAKEARKSVKQVFYVGESGKSVFASIFADDCVIQPDLIRKKLHDLADGEALLIEGRMPPWVREILKTL